jgi:hypothetical protein
LHECLFDCSGEWIAVEFACLSAFVVYLVDVHHRVPRIAPTTLSKDLHLTVMSDGVITPAIAMAMAPVVPMPSTDAIAGSIREKLRRKSNNKLS